MDSQQTNPPTTTQTKPKKYIFINGVMKLNPQFTLYEQQHSGNAAAPVAPAAPTKHASIEPLSVISNYSDLHNICNESGVPIEIEMPSSTMNSIQFMNSDTYLSNGNGNSEQNLFDGLCEYFTIYEVPIGLISKLMELRNYRLNFMIDDSGFNPSIISLLMIHSSFHPCIFSLLLLQCFAGSMSSRTDV
jgi:hypothetical protein